MHHRGQLGAALITRQCNRLCLLEPDARLRLLDLERRLTGVTACKAQHLRDIKTLEAQLPIAQQSLASASYSLHAQRLVPQTVLGNDLYRGAVLVDPSQLARNKAAAAGFLLRSDAPECREQDPVSREAIIRQVAERERRAKECKFNLARHGGLQTTFHIQLPAGRLLEMLQRIHVTRRRVQALQKRLANDALSLPKALCDIFNIVAGDWCEMIKYHRKWSAPFIFAVESREVGYETAATYIIDFGAEISLSRKERTITMPRIAAHKHKVENMADKRYA